MHRRLRGSGRAYGKYCEANLYMNYLPLGEAPLCSVAARPSANGVSPSGSGPAPWAAPCPAPRGALLYAFWYAALGLLPRVFRWRGTRA